MSSVDPLVERLAAEVAAATEPIHSLQTEAAKVFLGQEQRFMLFRCSDGAHSTRSCSHASRHSRR